MHERNAQAETNAVKGFVYALIGVVLISPNYVTAKYALAGFNPETFSTIWTAAAAFYAFVILMLSSHRRKLALPRGALGKVLVLGAATAPAMLLGWHALSRLDPSFAAALARFMPVFLILLGAVFLGERLTIKELPAGVLMVLGGVVATVGRWQAVGQGTVLVLLVCVFSGVLRLLAKMSVGQVHPNSLAFYRVAIAAPLIAAWTFCTGEADFDVPAKYWAVAFLGAFLGPCASHLFLFRAYRHWELSRASLLLALEPLLVLPLAYVFLRRLPSTQGLIGGGVILLGGLWLAWVQLRQASRARLDTAPQCDLS